MSDSNCGFRYLECQRSQNQSQNQSQNPKPDQCLLLYEKCCQNPAKLNPCPPPHNSLLVPVPVRASASKN